VRFEVVRGRWAVLTAVLVVAFACAAPRTVATIQSPTPSPSPTPTAPLQASGPGFHVGEVGVSYAPVALAATGGVQPYHWTVSAGALPPGLTVGADGSISGSPTGAGDYTFTIQAADSGDSTATIPGHISVATHLALSFVQGCETYCNVELGCVTVCGSFGQLSGGVEPFHTTLVDGTLPSGTALNGLELTGGFAGASGWLQFTVQVGDSLGATATLAPKFWMYPHISFSGGTIPTNPQNPCWWTGAGQYAPGCTAQFPYGGGTPHSGTVTVSTAWANYTCNYQPACSSPPPTPTIVVGGGMITVSVPRGYTAGTSGYKGTLTVTLTNQDLCSAGPVNCSASADVSITQQSG
jgi:hypothetical protein